MSDLFGNHMVGFSTRWLKWYNQLQGKIHAYKLKDINTGDQFYDALFVINHEKT